MSFLTNTNVAQLERRKKSNVPTMGKEHAIFLKMLLDLFTMKYYTKTNAQIL